MQTLHEPDEKCTTIVQTPCRFLHDLHSRRLHDDDARILVGSDGRKVNSCGIFAGNPSSGSPALFVMIQLRTPLDLRALRVERGSVMGHGAASTLVEKSGLGP